MKTIEEHRDTWKKIAIENNWYTKPFFVQVWKNKRGQIIDSVSFVGLKRDIILEQEE